MSEKIAQMVKKIASSLLLLSSIVLLVTPNSIVASTTKKINIVINGNPIAYTKDSGSPYIDKKNRVMVPFKATIKETGAAIGYDTKNEVAIIVTEHNRIEIPLDSSTYYKDNKAIKNKPKAVAKAGIAYIPIKDILKLQGFTVEWDKKTSTINAYTYEFDEDEFVPYSTSSLETLLSNIAKGNVVYINGSYYATPDYVKMITNTQIHYWDKDLNKAIYPNNESRYDFTDYEIEWASGIDDGHFDKIEIEERLIPEDAKNVEKSDIPGFAAVYGFYKNGLTDIKLLYIVDEMTDEFMKSRDATGTFNGIRMKKEKGTLYFNYEDLKAKNLCK